MQVNHSYSSLSSVFIQSPTNRRRLEEQGSVVPADKNDAVADTLAGRSDRSVSAQVAPDKKHGYSGDPEAGSLDAEALYAKASTTLWNAKHSSGGKAAAYIETYNQPSIDALREQLSFSAYA